MTIITPETVQLIHLVLQQWHFKTSVKVHTNFLHTNYKIQIQAEQLTQLKKKKKKVYMDVKTYRPLLYAFTERSAADYIKNTQTSIKPNSK